MRRKHSNSPFKQSGYAQSFDQACSVEKCVKHAGNDPEEINYGK